MNFEEFLAKVLLEATDKSQESRVKGHKERVAKYYEENPDDPDAEDFKKRGSDWTSGSPRSKYGSRKKK